ncbi:unnamed protein product [Lota lota]
MDLPNSVLPAIPGAVSPVVQPAHTPPIWDTLAYPHQSCRGVAGRAQRLARERGAYGGGVTLHVISLVQLHWQRGSSRGHMSPSVDGNTYRWLLQCTAGSPGAAARWAPPVQEQNPLQPRKEQPAHLLLCSAGPAA